MASSFTLSDVSLATVLRLPSEEELEDEKGRGELEEDETGAEGILVRREGKEEDERVKVAQHISICRA